MATLANLVDRGALIRITVPLGAREQPERAIYGTPNFIRWLATDLPNLASNWNIFETPEQQMDVLLHEFISGGPMPYDQRFKPWRRVEAGTWYLKTADLRIFGWFPQKDHFIAAFGELASIVKQRDLYYGFVGQVVRVRNALDLDEPKFVAGANPDDVLSIRN